MNAQFGAAVSGGIAILALFVLAITGHCSAAVGPFSLH